MANDVRRRLAALGLTAAMAATSWVAADSSGSERAPAGGDLEQVAVVRGLPWWWWGPAPTSTTVRPTTTTVRPTTTTTVRPTTTTVRPTTTTVRPTTTTTVRPTTTTVRPTTTTAPPPPPPTTVAPAGAMTSAQLSEAVARVNAKRATGTTCGGVAYPAVPALAVQGNLNTAADGHARDMATRNYFSHTGANGSTAGQRMTAAGYRWSAWGENIAAGQTTVQSVVDGWFASAGHCQNFMSSTFTQIGFGRAENAASTYRIYWVANLGRPA